MRIVRFITALFVLMGMVSLNSNAVEIRDYYDEPGINPFKETLNQNFHEHIDPFSGSLQLKYTDAFIPGNGGMDIRINRTYTFQGARWADYRNFAGLGWTIHFGRIVAPVNHKNKICLQGTWSVHTKDNPSLELPDGGRELLVLRDPVAFPALGGNDLITRSNWKAICNPSGNDMIVTSPDGMKYTMDQFFSGSETAWYTSCIDDLNGNWLSITYTNSSIGGFLVIDKVPAAMGVRSTLVI